MFAEDSFDNNNVAGLIIPDDSISNPSLSASKDNLRNKRKFIDAPKPPTGRSKGYASLVHADPSGTNLTTDMLNFKQPTISQKQILTFSMKQE